MVENILKISLPAEDGVSEQVPAAVLDVVQEVGLPVRAVLQVEGDLLRPEDGAGPRSNLETRLVTFRSKIRLTSPTNVADVSSLMP